MCYAGIAHLDIRLVNMKEKEKFTYRPVFSTPVKIY